MATPRSTAWSVSCAPRSCRRSTAAPPRSSGGSSPRPWGSETGEARVRRRIRQRGLRGLRLSGLPPALARAGGGPHPGHLRAGAAGLAALRPRQSVPADLAPRDRPQPAGRPPSSRPRQARAARRPDGPGGTGGGWCARRGPAPGPLARASNRSRNAGRSLARAHRPALRRGSDRARDRRADRPEPRERAADPLAVPSFATRRAGPRFVSIAIVVPYLEPVKRLYLPVLLALALAAASPAQSWGSGSCSSCDEYTENIPDAGGGNNGSGNGQNGSGDIPQGTASAMGQEGQAGQAAAS